jgi:hypothetical protein
MTVVDVLETSARCAGTVHKVEFTNDTCLVYAPSSTYFGIWPPLRIRRAVLAVQDCVDSRHRILEKSRVGW